MANAPPWVEALSPHSASIAVTASVSTESGVGMLSGSRASDAPVLNGESCIASMGIVWQDCAVVPCAAYVVYLEAWRASYAHPGSIIQAQEAAVINQGPAAQTHPYAANPPGLAEAYRASSGKPGCGPSRVSTAYSVVNGEGSAASGFLTGFLSAAGALLRDALGMFGAIRLALEHSFIWHNPDGSVAGYLRCDGGNGTGLIMAPGCVVIQNRAGENVFAVLVDDVTGAAALYVNGVKVA